MREVDLTFLIDDVDITFNTYTHKPDETYIDMIFYDKSYDGGENHEIHTIWIVEHDKTDIYKPYKITHFYKEYMWNMLISFQQENCECVQSITKNTISEVLHYLKEENVLNDNFTCSYIDKNPKIILHTNTTEIKYNICLASIEAEMGDYTNVYSYTLSLDQNVKDNFDCIHYEIMEHFNKHFDILYDEPKYILNKLARMNKGPFEPLVKYSNNRYNHFTDDSNDTDDTDDEDESFDCTYSKHKTHELYELRLDIEQFNSSNNYVNPQSTLMRSEKFYDYFSDLKHYETIFHIYYNKFNKNNLIWRFDSNKYSELNLLDEYYSTYERKIMDTNLLHDVLHYVLHDIITSNKTEVESEPELEQIDHTANKYVHI